MCKLSPRYPPPQDTGAELDTHQLGNDSGKVKRRFQRFKC